MGPDYKTKVSKILQSFLYLFQAQLSHLKYIKIPIPFLQEQNLKDLKQALFNLSKKNYLAIDEILNKLKYNNCIEQVSLSDPSLVASPVFII